MKKTSTLVNEYKRLHQKVLLIEQELKKRFEDNPVECVYCKRPLDWNNNGTVDDNGISVYRCECVAGMK